MIDPAWAGHILQFGFLSKATQYEPSGVFYDNVSFAPVNPCPEPTTFELNSLTSRSGEVGFADLTRLLNKWGPC